MLMQKTLATYVQPALLTSLFATCALDLWMYVGAHDVFVVVVNFMSNNQLKPKNVVVGLFDVTTIIMGTMIPKFWALLHKFSLTKKIIMYVKDKGSNFQPYAITMNFVVSINVWACWSLFMGLCFGHAISKVFYNVIIEEKISWGRNLCICKGCKN